MYRWNGRKDRQTSGLPSTEERKLCKPRTHEEWRERLTMILDDIEITESRAPDGTSSTSTSCGGALGLTE
jgi:hypothetical protein